MKASVTSDADTPGHYSSSTGCHYGRCRRRDCLRVSVRVDWTGGLITSESSKLAHLREFDLCVRGIRHIRVTMVRIKSRFHKNRDARDWDSISLNAEKPDKYSQRWTLVSTTVISKRANSLQPIRNCLRCIC